jgi:branched-chain amino acid transport system permease protein
MNRRKMVKRIGSVALLLVLFLVPQAITQPYVLHILIIIGINVVLASSLRFIATSGQLSLAHAGMMSVGAYASTLLVMKLGLSFWVGLPLGGLAAMSLAFLVGFPFVRLKGIYFTMVTLFLTEFIRLIIEQWKSLTGGPSGIIAIPRPSAVVIPGLLNADFASKADFYYLALIITLVTLLILYAIEFSRAGTTFLSIQQSDSLAESVGVNSSWLRVLAFAIGCFFAGLGGAFYSHYLSAINPGSFGFLVSTYILIYMVFGGMRKFPGPIIGAIILTVIPELASGFKEYEPFVFAGILLFVIFFLRGGVVSLPERIAGVRKKGVSHA